MDSNESFRVCFILGGWLLVSNVEFGSPSPKVSVETTYRGISNSHMVLQKGAMKELRKHLFFTHLRFHCRKKLGRTFHVVTASNSSGEAVVQYFSGQTDEQPDACGSFVRLKWDDSSNLAGICKDWGRLKNGTYFVGKWGHGEDQNRLYWYPAFGQYRYHLMISLNHGGDLTSLQCDDGGQGATSIGDFWKVFVR